MGNWNVRVYGTGAHHNAAYPQDANRLAARFVADLRAAGHSITRATIEFDDTTAPYVCPGCHAVGSELCAAWCPDAELERERGASELDDAYDDGAEYCWACGDRLEDGNCDSCADAAVPS